MREDRLREESIKKTLQKINTIENAVNQPYYNLAAQQKVEVNIRVDNSVPHGLFKPDPKLPGGWIASEQTFKAMKKDIFALDQELIDLADFYTCHSCHQKLDRQFWHRCPYCEAMIL